MRLSWLLIIPSAVSVAAVPNPSVPPPPDLNVDNPSSGDPTSPPKSLSFPLRAPKPEAILEQPAQCDGENPSDDCFRALSSGSGGYLWYARDSMCNDDQKDALSTAVWDAYTLALWSSNFPNVDGARGTASGKYYMGPDFPEFQDRIGGNLKRASDFKKPTTSDKTYITVSCKDTKNKCGTKIGGKFVGGYGWTDSGWFGYYHYITLCSSFWTVSTLDQKIQEIENDLGGGSTTKATDMRYLQTSGQYFLHEMMHTRLTYGDQPPIIDEFVRPPDKNEGHGLYAYGPKLVHRLASRAISRGGGAKRGSTNADSYAMLANCLWWWDVTGYFPAAPADSDLDQANADDNELVFLNVDLGQNADLKTANIDGLLDVELAKFGNGDPDADGPGTNPASPSNGEGSGRKFYILPVLQHIIQGFVQILVSNHFSQKQY
jgi:hypothetical protein